MNLSIDLTMTFQPGEYNFERPAYDFDIRIDSLHLTIDPKQFSDLLDFIKFQNYSKVYGTIIHNEYQNLQLIYFVFKDRCKEYRALQSQKIAGATELTSEQKERIKVIDLVFFSYHYRLLYFDI